MRSVQLPPTLAEAQEKLTSLDSLVTAREWERAAIVTAFTHTGVNRFDVAHENSCTIRQFAEKGIQGLRTQDSVRRYRNAWLAAVESGHAEPAEPGAKLRLPELPFPPHEELGASERKDDLAAAALAEGAGIRSTEQIATHLPALRAAIKGDKKVAKAAEKALMERYTAESRKPKAEPSRYEKAIKLVSNFAKIHKAVDKVISLVIDGKAVVNDNERDAILAEVRWLRTALGYIEEGVQADSLDVALAKLVEAQT